MLHPKLLVVLALAPACVADVPVITPESGQKAVALSSASDQVDAVEICPGVTADRSGNQDASAPINACLQAFGANGGTLLVPAGAYLLSHGVTLSAPHIMLGTSGLVGSTELCNQVSCARLFAAPDFDDGEALIYGDANASNTIFDHLIVDGNRANRPDSLINQATCSGAAATGARGRNVELVNASNDVIGSSFFVNAGCGTSFAIALVPSYGMIVVDNVFADNGSHDITGTWSDGLTIGEVYSSRIDGNYFYNNSDVALILGTGSSTSIRNNTIAQTWQAAFAGLMFTNWTVFAPTDQQQWADFRGAAVEGNRIVCDALCDIAMQFGVAPWAGGTGMANLRAIGGTVTGNIITSRKQMIEVAGAGSPDYPIVIYGNVYDRPNGEYLPGGYGAQVQTSDLNIQAPGADSFVDVAGDPTPATAYSWNDAF